MLLANMSDKNVAQIVESVQGGSVVKFLKSMGAADTENVMVYGVKASKEREFSEAYDGVTPVFLNSDAFGVCGVSGILGTYLVQVINDKAKAIGYNKTIEFMKDNQFSESKGLPYTIGLPSSLRVGQVGLCKVIVELIFAIINNVNEEVTEEMYNNTNMIKVGSYRPDLPPIKSAFKLGNRARPLAIELDDDDGWLADTNENEDEENFI